MYSGAPKLFYEAADGSMVVACLANPSSYQPDVDPVLGCAAEVLSVTVMRDVSLVSWCIRLVLPLAAAQRSGCPW